jgi:hypothetical protein
MASGTAKAVGYLELDISGFTAALDQAKKLLAGLGISFAAFKTADFWVEHIKGAIDFGNAMYVAGQKLGGFDPGKLLLVQKALETTGISADEANASISDMLKSHRNFDTLFQNKGDYKKALGQAQQNYGPEAQALSDNAGKLSKVSQIIDSIYEKGRGFFVELTGQFVQPLYSLLVALNSVDLSGIADALGSAVDKVANVLIGLFASGKLVSTFKTGLEVAAKTFANYMAGALKTFAKGLASIDWVHIGLGLLKVLGGAFTKLIADLSSGLIKAAKYFGAGVATVLQAAIEKTVSYIDSFINKIAGFFGKKFIPGGQYHAQSFDDNLKGINGSFSTADKFLDNLHGQGQNMVNKGVGAIGKGLGGFKFDFKPADLFPGLKEETAQLVAGLSAAEKAGLALGKVPDRLKGNLAALGPQEPVKIIADSLAHVGGGGGYIRSSMSIAEREAMAQTEEIRQSKDVLIQIAKNTKPTSGQDPKINRG